MRLLILIIGVLATSLVAAPADKPAAKGKKAAGPHLGVKTPGILIPFELLKAEAEVAEPTKPEFLFFSESLYVPGKDSIEKLNAKTNKPGDAIAGIKQPCSGMVSAFESLWISSCGDKSLVRVNAKTGKTTATLPVGAPTVVGGIAATADSVWLLTDAKATLTRIDPEQNAVVGELRLPVGCRSFLFAENSLWIACPEENRVLRINPATNLVDKTIEVSGTPQSLAFGEGSVWAFCKKDGKLDRIDPKTNKVSKTIELEVPGIDGALAFGEGSLWVSQAGYPITRVNPTTEKVAQQFFGEAGGGPILTSTGALWLVDANAGKLLHIDPKRVLATLAE